MHFEVEIELTKEDFFNHLLFDFFYDSYINIKKYFFIIFLIIVVLIAIVSLFIKYITLQSESHLFITIGIILGIVFVICFGREGIFSVFFPEIDKLIKQSLNKYKFIFDDDKFIVENKLEKQKYKASVIFYVLETKNYLFLYKYSKKALAIPENMFHLNCYFSRIAWIIPKNQISENTYNDIIKFFHHNDTDIRKFF